MVDPGISVQYGSGSSFAWASLLSSIVPALVGASIALVVNWLANRHQTMLQRERLVAEDARAQRDEKRMHGEELYELFDTWTRDILKHLAVILDKLANGVDVKSKDLEAATGDRAKYQKIVMLAHVDFPQTKTVMDRIGLLYQAIYLAANTANRESISASTIGELVRVQDKLGDEADSFATLLIQEMRSLYDADIAWYWVKRKVAKR